MFGSFGIWELIIILGILLLIFGPSRLGEIGSSLGKGIKGFRRSLKDDGTESSSELENSGTTSESRADGFSAPKESDDQSTK